MALAAEFLARQTRRTCLSRDTQHGSFRLWRR